LVIASIGVLIVLSIITITASQCDLRGIDRIDAADALSRKSTACLNPSALGKSQQVSTRKLYPISAAAGQR